MYENPVAAPSAIEHIESLNAREDYRGIIDFIEAMPADRRTSEIVGQLARAYNNLAAPGETELFEKALALLDTVPEKDRQNHYWHFRRAYALFYLDRVIESLPHWEKALKFRPGDSDTETFIESSRRCLAAEHFFQPFSERADAAWVAFVADEAVLRRFCASGPVGRRQAEEKVRRIFGQLIHDRHDRHDRRTLRIEEDGEEGERLRLVFSPAGRRLTALALREIVHRAPDVLRGHWRVVLGVGPGSEASGAGSAPVEAEAAGRILRADELHVRPEKKPGGEWRLVFTGPALFDATQDEAPALFEALGEMLDTLIGEAVRMRWFAEMTLRTGAAEEGMPLEAFPAFVRETIPESEGFDFDDYLALKTEVHRKPERKTEDDLLLDAYRIETVCPMLHNDYLKDRTDLMTELERQGATAGFLWFVPKTDTPQERDRLRDLLEARLRSLAPEALLTTGSGSAIDYEYVEFVAWKSDVVFEKLVEWVTAEEGVLRAGFRSFLRRARGVRIKDVEETAFPKAPEERIENSAEGASDQKSEGGRRKARALRSSKSRKTYAAD